ncbi:MAG: tail fiber domain-containing protein, partial [Patescibacteria group bacterium]
WALNGSNLYASSTSWNVVIGETSPIYSSSVSKLSILGNGMAGRDTGSNNTAKWFRYSSGHYNNSEEPATGLMVGSGSDYNEVRLGGGTSIGNAATLIRFYTAANSTTTTGSERMRIVSNGNVGIGNVAPSTKLDVSGTGKFSDTLKIDNATADKTLLYLNGADSDKWIGFSGHGLHIGTDIYSHSTVYLGPKGSSTGVLNGTVYVNWASATPTRYNRWKILATPTNGSISGYANNGTTVNTLISSVGNSYFNVGNVGIGTTTPGAKLDVYGSAAIFGTGSNGKVIISDDSFGGELGMITDDDKSIAIEFYDGTFRYGGPAPGGETLIISGNNVGIGTSTPATNLEIVAPSSASSTAAIRLSSTKNDSTWANQAFGKIEFYSNDGSAPGPQVRAEVGAYPMSNIYGQGGILIFKTADSGVEDEAVEQMRITQVGRVGIGTQSPGYKLHVVGETYATATSTALAFVYTSDRNAKKDIVTLNNSLENILKLRGVSFNWKNDGHPSIGLIAQEVEKIYPELVAGEEGKKGVQYANLVAPLIEAVKEQQRQIENLEMRLKYLESRK